MKRADLKPGMTVFIDRDQDRPMTEAMVVFPTLLDPDSEGRYWRRTKGHEEVGLAISSHNYYDDDLLDDKGRPGAWVKTEWLNWTRTSAPLNKVRTAEQAAKRVADLAATKARKDATIAANLIKRATAQAVVDLLAEHGVKADVTEHGWTQSPRARYSVETEDFEALTQLIGRIS